MSQPLCGGAVSGYFPLPDSVFPDYACSCEGASFLLPALRPGPLLRMQVDKMAESVSPGVTGCVKK